MPLRDLLQNAYKIYPSTYDIELDCSYRECSFSDFIHPFPCLCIPRTKPLLKEAGLDYYPKEMLDLLIMDLNYRAKPERS